MTRCAQELGPLRVLVSSAGFGWAQRTIGRDGTYESAADVDAFKKVVAINLFGTFDCIRVDGGIRMQPKYSRGPWPESAAHGHEDRVRQRNHRGPGRVARGVGGDVLS